MSLMPRAEVKRREIADFRIRPLFKQQQPIKIALIITITCISPSRSRSGACWPLNDRETTRYRQGGRSWKVAQQQFHINSSITPAVLPFPAAVFTSKVALIR